MRSVLHVALVLLACAFLRAQESKPFDLLLRSEAGKPLAGAEVVVLDMSRIDRAAVQRAMRGIQPGPDMPWRLAGLGQQRKTDPDGRMRIDGFAPGTLVLARSGGTRGMASLVHAADAARRRLSMGTTLVVGEDGAPVTWTLAAPARIVVRVRDAAGDPVPGMTVWVLPTTGAAVPVAWGTTRSDGVAQIDDERGRIVSGATGPARVRVVAGYPGAEPGEVVEVSRAGPSEVSLALPATGPLVLRLPEGWSGFEGMVGSLSVEGADPGALPIAPVMRGRDVVFERVALGKRYVFTPQQFPVAAWTGDGPRDAGTPRVVDLELGGADPCLHGRFAAPAAAEPPRGTLLQYPFSRDGHAVQGDRVGRGHALAGGRFFVLPQSELTARRATSLRILAEDGAAAWRAALPAVTAEGTLHDVGQVPIERLPLLARGRVVAPSGVFERDRPVVYARQPGAAEPLPDFIAWPVSEFGDFALYGKTDLAAIELVARGGGVKVDPVRCAPGAQELRLAATALPRITGRITGAPLDGLRLSYESEGSQPISIGPRFSSAIEDGGTFRTEPLDVQRGTVTLWGMGLAEPLGKAAFDPASPAPVLFELPQDLRSVAVTVYDEASRLIPRAAVFARDPAGPQGPGWYGGSPQGREQHLVTRQNEVELLVLARGYPPQIVRTDRDKQVVVLPQPRTLRLAVPEEVAALLGRTVRLFAKLTPEVEPEPWPAVWQFDAGYRARRGQTPRLDYAVWPARRQATPLAAHETLVRFPAAGMYRIELMLDHIGGDKQIPLRALPEVIEVAAEGAEQRVAIELDMAEVKAALQRTPR